MAKSSKSSKKSDKKTGDGIVSKKLGTSAEAFDQAVAEDPEGNFMLTLYVSGLTPHSRRAIDNIQTLCEEHMAGRYELKIVDIYQQPGLAKAAQIVAVPTLIKRLPPPLRRLVGDLSDPGRVLVALGIGARRAGGVKK